MRQRLQLTRLDHPAGQPDTSERAVGCRVHLQGAGAFVLVTGPSHHIHGTRSRDEVELE
jgi:hypothetical protein